jgi:TPR repeat protein
MRCDQKDAAECDLAAAAYEQGSAGVTDPAKAANYRKIALTHWLSQCDKNSPTACITLADRYRAGNGVPQSDRNADALVERSRELCKVNPAAACADLPKSAER